MYQIKTDKFEGPLDLLLELIEKDDLDITSLNLAKVADDYVTKLKELEERVSMRDMAEFLDVAARLILIKSRALIPDFDLTEEEELSAEELELRLREYKKFKDMGEVFREKLTKKLFAFDKLINLSGEVVFSPPSGISVKVLHNVFGEVIGEMSQDELLEEEMVENTVSLEERIGHILHNVEQRMATCFRHLYENGSRIEIIVTFLALLELLKQQSVRVDQEELFDDIKIARGN